MKNAGRRGFTLVELLVVIAIIGVLISLLLPAVQAAREAARRVQCANHLKQLATAFLMHHDTHGFYPSGGWHTTWIGDPQRGYGPDQPGGWVFNILPYMEQEQVRNMAATAPASARKQILGEMLAVPIPSLYCPSRRPAIPNAPRSDLASVLINATLPASRVVGKTDYAACVGNASQVDYVTYPASEAQVAGFPWEPYPLNGICFQRSDIRQRDVTDGTANTYMTGEKYLTPYAYGGS